ncbi:MAG TPA: monofunctional biosynthetic peptidoglycan transglycosylase [Thermoanaerobaculia bacterium]|nr:monofunctional biosynthetic peptidoglycan transglycosylase [Thermoanaerobaculia bacterium]
MKRIALILIAALVVWIVWEWIAFPDVAALASENPEATAFMEARKRRLRAEGKDDAIDYRFVPYGRISPNLRRAVLVSEDSGFYEHDGIDVEGVREALRRNWENRKLTHGGSTITQQLAKNLYLSPSRNPLRKGKEFLIARSLEKHLSKKRILELYLNVVELGEQVYGAEAGARHYFGKSAAALSASEAALLAGSLPNPRRMRPGNPNGRLRARQRIILSRMSRWGHLAEEEVLTQRRAVEPPPAAEPLPTGPELGEVFPVPQEETEPAPEDPDELQETPAEPPPLDPPVDPEPDPPPSEEPPPPPR